MLSISTDAVKSAEQPESTTLLTPQKANEVMKQRIAQLMSQGIKPTPMLATLHQEGFKSNRGLPLSASALTYYIKGIRMKQKKARSAATKPATAPSAPVAKPAAKPVVAGSTADAQRSLDVIRRLVASSEFSDAEKLLLIGKAV